MKDATVTLSVIDGTHRTWRSLWRERPRSRVLFIGRVTSFTLTRKFNGPDVLDVKADTTEREEDPANDEVWGGCDLTSSV